jgi:hypothetical protein
LSKNIKIKVYVSVILSVVLYECKTWSLTLKEERRLWVFVNRVLRRDEVTVEWSKLRSEKLNVNNCPTRCDYIQFIIFLQTALHVSSGKSTHHQEHI